MSNIRLNCPEAYHIEYLHSQGYGCRLIAQMIDRNEDWLCKSMRDEPGSPTLARYVGRLSNGKRPAKELARSWTKGGNYDAP